MTTCRKIKKIILSLAVVLISNMPAWAAVTEAPFAATNTDFINSDSLLRWIMAGVIALFVIIIAVLANAVRVAGGAYQQKLKKERASNSTLISLILVLSMLSTSMSAQTTDKPAVANSFINLDIYIFSTIILLLFVVVLTLVKTLFVLMGIKKAEQLNADGKKARVITWFQTFNETVPIEEEEDLDMSHDYDGIRELDNKVPSWWTWAFFLSVLFAIIYLYRMFGSGTLPNQYVELSQANETASVEKAAYLKKGANNVDENTVIMMSGSDITEGSSLYAKNCVACHGANGQGGVGPNLTDDYWIHKGGIKDIFYTIKYGWAEKGMKSWQVDFSPMQMAQLASFVKSLHGTNPAAAKEKQGDLYTEGNDTAPSDSTASTTADTSAVKK